MACFGFTVCPVWPLRYLSTTAVARSKPAQANWRAEIVTRFRLGGKIVRVSTNTDSKTTAKLGTSLKLPMESSANDFDGAAVAVERRVVDELEINGDAN